jgi:hypothetical protein
MARLGLWLDILALLVLLVGLVPVGSTECAMTATSVTGDERFRAACREDVRRIPEPASARGDG